MIGGEISGTLRVDVDRVPGDGTERFLVEERIVARSESGIRGVGVGIPLRDEAFGEGDVDRDGCFAGGIEIKNGSFHAGGAAQAALEADFAEMFDEGRQVGGAGERKPVHGTAIWAGDGSKGAPFVDGEVVFEDLFCVGVTQRERDREEKRGGEEGEREEMAREPQAGDSRCQGFHWCATFTFGVREIISAMASDCASRKWAERFLASNGSFLPPAMAFCACSWCWEAGTLRSMIAAANSICGSLPRSWMALFTRT